ncbi:hypothetical protein [Tsukamurella paurometabola]|uniref:Uncharacterized protein n=1 Tax=Tsukamurella paurometabola TaxID=2061 RepID=A0ABS5NDV4_TSUPA|nr:hypothetical protein [Tsukamurella paurometabola]MBS4102454.1 hypothetical protein [Tsukamurella paurometabola]
MSIDILILVAYLAIGFMVWMVAAGSAHEAQGDWEESLLMGSIFGLCWPVVAVCAAVWVAAWPFLRLGHWLERKF